jgi:hypothetical protein
VEATPLDVRERDHVIIIPVPWSRRPCVQLIEEVQSLPLAEEEGVMEEVTRRGGGARHGC